MSVFKLGIEIGAVLNGSFRNAIAGAVGALGELKGQTKSLESSFADLGKVSGALFAIKSTARAAGDFEEILVRIGNTASLSGQQITNLREQIRALSDIKETNQSMSGLATGFQTLVSKGMSAEDASAMLRTLGQAATATGADINDLAKTAFTLNQNLSVAPQDMAAALDQLAIAGDQGAFELKDMAQYFPAIAASARDLGLKGKEGVATLGSALQVALYGAADPAQAANNMQNFMAKLAAPETVKRFKEHGVDLKRVLNESLQKGENPFEAMLKTIDKMLGSDETQRLFRIGDLFGDMQVQQFLKPMLQNMDKYAEFKDTVLNTSGKIVGDYARITAVYNQQSAGFQNAVSKLGESFGKLLLPPLTALMKVLTPVIDFLSVMIERFPVTTGLVSGLGLAVVTLLPALRLASVAFRILNIAMIANPVGAIIAGTVLLAGIVIDNWGTIRSFVTTTVDVMIDKAAQFGNAIQERFQAIKDFMVSLWEPVVAAWEQFGGFVDQMVGRISKPFEAIGKWFGGGKTAMTQPAINYAPASLYDTKSAAQTSTNFSHDLSINLNGLPQGTRATARSNSPAVGVDLRTGPMLSFAN
jgi:TP901 family phage tail tape measure protein